MCSSRRSIPAPIASLPGKTWTPCWYAGILLYALLTLAAIPLPLQKHKIGLKAPMTTPIGKGFRSLNLTLRKELSLYANVRMAAMTNASPPTCCMPTQVRPCYSLPGYKTLYDDVNLVTVRENTEGEYSGLEHQVVPGVVESLKVRVSVRSKKQTFVAECARNTSLHDAGDHAPC